MALLHMSGGACEHVAHVLEHIGSKRRNRSS
jgi:hypothetical protein